MKNLFARLLIIISLALYLQACCPNDGVQFVSYDNVDQMVQAVKATVKTVSITEMKELIEAGAPFQFIDCREEEVFAVGHIPGAVCVPRGEIGFSSKATNRRPRTIVMGNEKGSGVLAIQTLKKLKYHDVVLMDCSWEEWAKANPDLIEEGMGEGQAEPVAEESSGGCGG